MYERWNCVMKKSVLILLIAVLLMIPFAIYAIVAEKLMTDNVSFTVTIDSRDQIFDMPVVTVDDKLYVPLDEFCEKLGFQIHIDEKSGGINVRNNQSTQNITSISQEGTLITGRKYTFWGTDKETFNLQNYIHEHKLKYSTEYDTQECASTPEKAAELAQSHFALEHMSAEQVSIQVHYDMETDSWVLIAEASPGVVRLGGHSILVIQRSNGLITRYTDGLK